MVRSPRAPWLLSLLPLCALSGAAPALAEVVEAAQADDAAGCRTSWEAAGWPAGLPPLVCDTSYPPLASHHTDGLTELSIGALTIEGDLASRWSNWPQELQAAGYSIDHARQVDGIYTARVCQGSCDGDGPRWFFRLGGESPWYGVLMEASPVLPELTGDCEPLPELEPLWQVETTWNPSTYRPGGRPIPEDTSVRMGLANRYVLDFNRDGIPDALVPRLPRRQPRQSCPNRIKWEAWVIQDSCAVAIGQVEGMVDERHLGGSQLSAGILGLVTQTEVLSPADPVIRRAYHFAEGYSLAEEENEGSRCDADPSECEDDPQVRCRYLGDRAEGPIE